MKVYTARQAIFNRKQQVVAYELLFRDGQNNAFPNVESNQATAKLMLDSQFNQGLKAITSGKKALINFPEQALLDQLPSLLPADLVIIEILEDVRPSEQVYQACLSLFQQGYKLALDDFEYQSAWQPFLKICRLVKIDIMATPLNTIGPLILKLKALPKMKILAEKVETYEEFEQAKKMGFDFFQGYFFCKPEIVEQNDIDNNRSTILALYKEVLKADLNYCTISEYFEHDTALAYKLLRFINSGLFPLNDPIDSLKQALIYLGEEQVKKFVCLILTAHLAQNKPSELTELSIIRARFCELVALKVAPASSGSAFLLGLFSLIDAILDKPMDDIAHSLPINEDVQAGLLAKPGVLTTILNLIKAYESGSWWASKKACQQARLAEDALPQYYQQAIAWADAYKQ
ncbi:EAL and HDOD domain-containing protein [Pseudoalteromonas ulvae]|uniref:Histidine kinase n=1 Tax=Pseudoalteromonas ulvae TaxID=107327 RepID=A0A244CR16_PSEDV|nr:HDOD domain-containing protein [Pseudoalteromonas ulvae]OUL58044.1 histidine kinase [Pseudoalteromonas ulvae]